MMQKMLIVVPVYNAMPYLLDTVVSIMDLRSKEMDVLFVDDGSTDGSGEYLEAIEVKYRGVSVIRRSNAGPAAVMNFCIEYAIRNGYEYLSRCDADDINLPGRFQKQLAFMEKNQEVAAVSGNAHYIYENRRVGASTVPTEAVHIKKEILDGQRGLIQGCCTFRVSHLKGIGGYREKFTHSEDADLFMRLAERFPLGNLSDFVYEIRLHEQSHSVGGVAANTRLARYALLCSRARRRGLQEPELESFLSDPDWQDRIWQKRENFFLGIWRQSLSTQNRIMALGLKGLAGASDPIRVLRRFQRIRSQS